MTRHTLVMLVPSCTDKNEDTNLHRKEAPQNYKSDT